MINKLLATLLFVLSLSSFCANAQNTGVFIGSVDNNFSRPSSWLSGAVPRANDNIVIASGTTLLFDQDFTCGSLKIENDASFACGGHELTITGNVMDANDKVAIEISSSLIVTSSLVIPFPILEYFTDARDGRTYNTVTIGSQTWMAENLNIYTPAGSWYYDNDSASYSSVYGRLYDWATVIDVGTSSSANPSGVQGLCPSGWHLPSHAEWTELTDYLGGESVAGGKLKETGTTWGSPNTGATNESGFSALPGGYRKSDGSFYSTVYLGGWWSATENTTSGAWYRRLYYSSAVVESSSTFKGYGFSVRCVMD